MFNFGKRKREAARSRKWTFGTMLAFGIIGLGASFILAIEKFHLLEDPNAVLSCSFNLVLNCSVVMQTWQASVFGFPNMLIGLMAYPVVITTAVIGLAGANLPRWYWRAATVCYALGALFAYWLFFQSVYVIEVLCPWCLIVTFATTILLATITHYSFKENVFNLNKRVHAAIMSFLDKDYDKITVAAWLVFLFVLVFLKFGDSLFV